MGRDLALPSASSIRKSRDGRRFQERSQIFCILQMQITSSTSTLGTRAVSG